MTMQEILDAIYGTPTQQHEGAAKVLDKKQEALLDKRAAAHKPKLDWRHSIVDLLEVLGKPSDLKAREALAKELHYQGPLDGSAAMNEFLRKKVLDHLEIK
jgi:Domain of unknown function (DUF3597)